MSLFRVLVDFAARTAAFETGVQRMEKRLDGFAKRTQSVAAQTRSAFAKLGVGLSIVGLARLATQAIQTGDDLARAASKSGIAANAFTELAYAARQSDVPLEALSKSLKTMQVLLSKAGQGDEAPTETLNALGLSISALIALKPDEQFELLADRISQLRSPADRTRAAVELFGKAGADMLPMFEQGAEGIRKARDAAKQFGASLSEADLDRFKRADDALKQMRESADSLKRSFALGLAPSIQAIADKFAILTGSAGDAQRLRDKIDFLKQLGDLGGLNIGGFIEGAGVVISAKERDAFLKNYQAQLRALTETAAISSAGKPPPGFLVELPEIAVIGKDWAKEQEEAAKLAAKALDELRDSYKEVLDVGMDALREIETPGERILRQFDEWIEKVNTLKDTYPNLAAEIEEATARMAAHTQQQLDDLSRVPEKAEEVNDSMTVFAEQAARNMQDAFADFFYDMDGGFKGMVKGFADALRKMIANLLASQLLGFIGGLFSDKGGVIGAIGGAMQKRAAGGPVSAGRPYMVGESGPELFVSKSAGSIVPNNKLGGVTMAPVYNIDARGATMELVRALPGILAENNRQLMAAWHDARSRGAFA